jgi:hypothetical protein
LIATHNYFFEERSELMFYKTSGEGAGIERVSNIVIRKASLSFWDRATDQEVRALGRETR